MAIKKSPPKGKKATQTTTIEPVADEQVSADLKAALKKAQDRLKPASEDGKQP